MQPDFRKIVRRITPALLAFSTYLAFSPTPAEACHKYVSPYTGKTGCAARRADKRNGSSTKTSSSTTSSSSDTAGTSSTSTTVNSDSSQSTPAAATTTSVGADGSLPWPSGFACPWRVEPAEFAAWRGSRVDVLGGWASRTTWNDMRRYFGGHLRRDFASKAPIMVLGLPLLTKESEGDFAGCAAGKYDEHFRYVADKLKRYRSTEKILRLGWEANGNWYPWSINGQYDAYKSCFQRVATVIKTTDPSIKISWPVSGSKNRRNYTDLFNKAYPGNAYVDYIGMSLYDHWPAAKTQADWDRSFQPALNTILSLAKANGKKIGFGEWGLSQLKGGGGGDNPIFITNMYKFLQTNAPMIAYEVYYNCGSTNSTWRIYPSNANPKSSAEYRRLW